MTMVLLLIKMINSKFGNYQHGQFPLKVFKGRHSKPSSVARVRENIRYVN